MVSYFSWGANVILFVTACFLAAQTANAIFAALLTPPGDEVAPRPMAAPATAKTWAQRQVILDRNLFHSSTQEAALAPIEPIEEVEPTRLPLDLLGTAAADDPRLAWAAINDRETRDTLIVSIDDILKDKATVTRIERRRVLLRENGALRELTFGDEAQAEKPVRRAAARPPTRGARGRRSALNRVTVPRQQVEAALKNPGDLLSQAHIILAVLVPLDYSQVEIGVVLHVHRRIPCHLPCILSGIKPLLCRRNAVVGHQFQVPVIVQVGIG